jgi:hypothetical protein
MRFATIGFVLASLLVAGAASAAGGKGAGSEGGKGGAGPAAGGGGTGGGGATFAGDERVQPDLISGGAGAYKPWEVGATLEVHRLIRQNDLAGNDYAVPGAPSSGAANNKFFNELGLFARYDLTDRDRVGLRTYIYQRFLADTGETGYRTDDLIFTYTRLVPLPERFRLQASAWITAPISYDSQLQGLITAPRAILELDRRFGPLTLDFRTYDEVYVERYTSYSGSGGATPTPLNRLAFAFEAEFHMPFHEPLSLGADVYTAYTWYHNINTGPGGQNSTKDANGVIQDPTFGSQPIQQIYGGEIFVRYLLPPLAGLKADIFLALAQGDPTLGYTGLLHDGVSHGYAFYRESSEIYAALSLRY